MSSVSSMSVYEMIKVGLGPSSSHTMGPWKICADFADVLKEKNISVKDVAKIQVHLYGSMAITGLGHGTDIASVMGLTGYFYTEIEREDIFATMESIKQSKKLNLYKEKMIDFDYDIDLVLHNDESFPEHPNGMTIEATLVNGTYISQRYFSLGGGFIQRAEGGTGLMIKDVPNDLKRPKKVLDLANSTHLSIPELVMQNELMFRTKKEIEDYAVNIYSQCFDAAYRGITSSGELGGGLKAQKKAKKIIDQLLKGKTFSSKEEFIKIMETQPNDFVNVNQWISAFAMAVNEQNASLARIVTAPTNGASGVMPGVLMYAKFFLKNESPEKITRFMLIAGLIGLIFKENATVAGAAGGCQAEVGVSSAMCAAGLADWLGANAEQTLMASSMAMTNFLGLACDPVAGLVQIPCIERNATATIKAINAAYLALANDCTGHYVTLDVSLDAMWEIAQDMNIKFRETSLGGLARTFLEAYPSTRLDYKNAFNQCS